MAPGILGYFGLRSDSVTGHEAPSTKDAIRALPANWYTSKEMYELERRSIFSRKWLLMTHQVRVKEPGSFVRYNVAGYDFVLTRDRNGTINAFHNVCRHRAYPVVESTEGNAKILSCRYHGWSYGLNGKLAKAPGFNDLDFDKNQNGLFPIHVRIDANGFVWINMDSKDTPEVAWEDDFGGVDEQDRFKNYNFADYVFDHTWAIDAKYNWKIAADNYNECYHCKTTHPDLPSIANLETYDVHPKAGHIDHDAATTDKQRAEGLCVASTYYFPNASMTVTPHFFFMQKFLPINPTETHVLYEVYRNKNSPEDEFQRINKMYKRVMNEDKPLCDLAQKNLSAGVFINGELHPKMEKGPLYFQKQCREVVTEHHKREKKEGKEYWPAKQILPTSGNASASKEDEDFCSGLACGPGKEELVW
ncbi:ISP domain-containing protein [Lophiostoma macrostomum CBS 122681]|uniref:Choline monooxygenase, chloroplastic n=1 Tax=Lophiostoma macrostomum CBS 122681 TaxID=1314788 RepID=A0A6A6SQP7_9PLEO|nr:ISP domain-containing protein [Lophiostoma macrostomum CBS 122681]